MDLQAVIFDYGEVLSGPPDPGAHSKLLEISGVAEEPFEKSYWVHRLDYDADILNEQTFWHTIAHECEARFSARAGDAADRARRLDVDEREPRDAGLIPKIKEAGFKLGILSNMRAGVLRYMLPRFPWLAQFDHLTWSCELGLVKPDSAIYLHTVRKLGVAPDQRCLSTTLRRIRSVRRRLVCTRPVCKRGSAAERLERPGIPPAQAGRLALTSPNRIGD